MATEQVDGGATAATKMARFPVATDIDKSDRLPPSVTASAAVTAVPRTALLLAHDENIDPAWNDKVSSTSKARKKKPTFAFVTPVPRGGDTELCITNVTLASAALTFVQLY